MHILPQHTTRPKKLLITEQKHVTHLYNGMNAFHHRNPGVIGAACDNENVTVELIVDGVHSHPSTVRTTFKMFGDDRIIMISDSNDGMWT